MYFKQIDEIVNGTKTQTRRVCKPEEYDEVAPIEGDFVWRGADGELYVAYDRRTTRKITSVRDKNARLKWQVGRDYAVSPGRGKPGLWWNPETKEVAIPYKTKRYKSDLPQMLIHELKAKGYKPLRIRLTDICREPLQSITDADAIAEGYPLTWLPPHDSEMEIRPMPPQVWYRQLWQSINTRAPYRWKDNPDVWVLTFEVVTDV